MADRFCGTGRRKKSVARVALVPGTGNVTINGHVVYENVKHQTSRQENQRFFSSSPDTGEPLHSCQIVLTR